MFIRNKYNKSGSVSIQILEKRKRKNILIETIGSSKNNKEIKRLIYKAELRLKELKSQQELDIFSTAKDQYLIDYLENDKNIQVINIGPELVLGKIFDSIGLNQIKESIFRHIVLARLTYPVSKLRTTEYLLQHQNIDLDVDKVYRFLDKFHKEYKEEVETIVYEHSKKILGEIRIVFYDMTTLYFEAENEDDLRKIGFSKDGKFQCPQIMLGLLVGENGYPIGYNIFEGNTFEGHTMIPAIQKMQKKYNLPKPIVIADSGLLSKDNLEKLQEQQYEFILGARIKNETEKIKKEILDKTKDIENGQSIRITKSDWNILIISFSKKRSKKDVHNREKGVKRLQKKITGGKLTKTSINNRGYNKFLNMEGETKVTLDNKKIEADKSWDGLKGYITNSKTLSNDEIIANYKHLWKIEKAFRISKSDLRIRPIFHRKRDRIEAHLTIAFAAYAIFKELERLLKINKINISPAKAIEQTKTIFQLLFELPDSHKIKKVFNNLNKIQKQLLQI